MHSQETGTQQIINENYNSQQVNINIDGVIREYIISVPEACQDSNSNCPAVIMFHGGGGNGKKFYNLSGWKELGEEKNFVTVFPTAQKFCIYQQGEKKTKNYWTNFRKLDQICPNDTVQDDILFIDSVLTDLESKYHCNKHKIYAVGFSNGLGLIQDRLLVERSDRFEGFAGAGNLLDTVLHVNSVHNKPFLLLAGQKDPLLMKANDNFQLPTTVEEYEQSALKKYIQNHLTTLGLSDNYLSKATTKGLRLHYDEPLNDTASIFRLAIMKDVKHQWPNKIVDKTDFNAPRIIWNFFKHYK